MSAQSSLIWMSYWPVSDYYPLEPSWAELHSAQGVGVDASVEALISQDFLVPYGLPWSATLDLVDMTLIDELDLPDHTYVRTDTLLSRRFGWDTPIVFTTAAVYDVSNDWTGKVTLGLDTVAQTLMGFDEAWKYQVRVITSVAGTQQPLYASAGSVAIRR